MCGRFSLKASPDDLEKVLGAPPPPGYRPRFNIAPTQEILAVTTEEDRPSLRMLKWGLVPFWADDPSIGGRMINARAETVAEKPAYRSAFARRRCLVVADGFYEWQRLPGGKRPMRIRLRTGEPFLIAGLWERWAKQGMALESCTLLTTGPNDLMQPIHDRMPVILDADASRFWLSSSATSDDLLALLRPFPADRLEAYEVSTMVNNPAHDIPECLDAVEQPA